MNNSFLAIESSSLAKEGVVDNSPKLREREGQLIKIIDSLQVVQSSNEWSSLKTEVFDGLATSLEKELAVEARKENPDTLKLNRLAGELKWAEKYSDLKKLENDFRLQLTHVRQKLYG